MSGSIACDSINNFLSPEPSSRSLSSRCGLIRGVLRSVEPAPYGTIIASFDCHCVQCGYLTVERVPLPIECKEDLAPLIGRYVGIMHHQERYILHEFPVRQLP